MKLDPNIIVVEVSGGLVQNVFSSGDQSVLIVDFDCEDRPTWLRADNPAGMDAELAELVKDKMKDLARR